MENTFSLRRERLGSLERDKKGAEKKEEPGDNCFLCNFRCSR